MPNIFLLGGDAFDLENESMRYKVDARLRFQGSEVQFGELEAALFSPSLFSDTLVIIEEANALNAKLEALVIAFAKRPLPRIFLLVHAAKRSELCKHLTVVEIAESKPWERQAKIADWIVSYLRTQGVKISHQVAAGIAQTAATDRFLLRQELDKLATYVGEKKEITQQDVLALLALDSQHTVWQMTDAFLSRDIQKAQSLLQSLLELQVSPFLIIRQLRNVTQQALMMLSLASQGVKNIQEHFPQLKGKSFDKNMALAVAATAPFLTKALLLIDKTELALKNSPFDEQALLMKCLL